MIYYLLVALIPILASAELNFAPQAPNEIVVNNRILVRVLGKPISVIDVMKNMDLYISRNYPELIDSKAGRFQFYSQSWRDTLNQMIDNELMLADAESREVKVTDGEVREMVQDRFGPNIMGTLDRLGLTYDEAREMTHNEMIVQRMQWLRVYSKALQKVTSQEVKKGFTEYCKHNPPKEEWKYQMLTIRGETGSALSDQAYEMLLTQPDLNAVAEKLQAELPPDSPITISVSQDYAVEDKNLAQPVKEILSTLEIGQFSKPSSQVSRDNSPVSRILYLKEHMKTNPLKFEDLANRIKDALIQKAAGEETQSYQVRLRTRFGYDAKTLEESIPPDFQPFSMR